MVTSTQEESEKVDHRPTLHDVARAADVSIMTASRALNGQARVSAETRERVLSEAARLGYRPSFSARALRARESQLLGFRAPNLMLPVHVEIIQGARDYASQEGYRLLLEVDPDESASGDTFTTDGDLVMGEPPAFLRPSLARCVSLMGRPSAYDIDACGTNLAEATLDALHHLADKGYRRIGLLHHALISPAFSPSQRLIDSGCDQDPELIQVVSNDKSSVLEGLSRLMSLDPRPDAIAVVHVVGTPHVLRELHRHHFVIGRDIGFVGTEVSSSEWGDLIAPRMTAIQVPARQVGAEGAARLIARLRGDRSPARQITIPTMLIERESTPGPWR
ncbi:MAG: LacI family DNA-binding transcriptional regulator [Thermomicrobiales bacterium]|nr:LacI family DNA-binding transcriptional regulator [Thermomicrobiales bacterium]